MAQTPVASPLRVVAQAILARLAPLGGPPPLRVRSVRMVDRVKRAEDLFSAPTPSLTLVYSGSPKFTPMGMGHGRVAHSARWVVLLAVGSLASDAARIEGTAGANAEAGLFELIDLVRATLQARIAADRPISLLAIDCVVSTPTCTVWGFRLETIDEELATDLATTREALLTIDGALALGDPADPDAPVTPVHVPITP